MDSTNRTRPSKPLDLTKRAPKVVVISNPTGDSWVRDRFFSEERAAAAPAPKPLRILDRKLAKRRLEDVARLASGDTAWRKELSAIGCDPDLLAATAADIARQL